MFREVLRNNEDQIQLERDGFVVVDMMVSKNYPWINETLAENGFFQNGNSRELQESLNEKLQSKVEYRFINCSPLFYEVIDRKNEEEELFSINDSIVNEDSEASFSLIIPVFNSEKEVLDISIIPGGQKLSLFPRKEKSKLKLNYNELTQLAFGQALILCNHLPYKILSQSDFLMLDIAVAPYEARLKIYKEKASDYSKLECFKITPDKYIDFRLNQLKIQEELRKLEEVEPRELIIPIDDFKKKSVLCRFIRALKN